jgi:plasmid stabilization system protein ParE
MAEYRLTDRARADLIDIYDFTESKFGVYQADASMPAWSALLGFLPTFPSSVSRLTNWRRAIDVSAFNHI